MTEAVSRVWNIISAEGLYVTPLPRPDRSGYLYALTHRPALARLVRATRVRLFFEIDHRFTVAQDERGEWVVRTVEYIYTLYDDHRRGDQAPRLWSYHYHPAGRSDENVVIPHLHVYVPADVAGVRLEKVHFPTGHISLADVVELLVDEYGVELRPPHTRIELQRIIDETRGSRA